MAEDFVSGTGATGLEETGGERIGLHYRAPHASPRPLIHKEHAAKEPRPSRRRTSARHQRATVVSSGNPAVVQLEDSDTALSVPLAQHVTTVVISSGGTVIVASFDDANPNDAVIVAAY